MTKLGEACLIEKGQDEEKGFFFFFFFWKRVLKMHKRGSESR